MQNKYNYPELERIDTDVGRHYLDSDNNPVPSVTTVLSNTSKSKDGLIQWRNRVGNEEAERIIKQSTDIGTAVHEGIEKYLLNQSWDNFSESSDQLLAKRMTNKFINDGLNGISEVWGLEVGLILDNLYAGTADCVGKYKDIPTLIDFKTAKKIKKREWIDDYFLQGCAYANAHNEMFETNIENIAIFMCSGDCQWQLFESDPKDFKDWELKWAQRLEKFYKLS